MQDVKKALNQNLNSALTQASQLEASGDFAKAESIYIHLLSAHANAPTELAIVWHCYGLLAFRMNNLDLAVQRITQAAIHNPLQATYQCDLCELCRRMGRLNEAILCGVAATKLAPKNELAHYNLGLAYFDAKNYPAAIIAYKKSLKTNPKYGIAWNNLGSALSESGRDDESIKAHLKAVALNPRHAEALNNLGAHYVSLGELSSATKYLEAAIDAQPNLMAAHSNISAIKTYTQNDPHVEMLKDFQKKQVITNSYEVKQDAESAIHLNFALGKALDDLGCFDEAFAAYEKGNNLKYQQVQYDNEEQFQINFFQQIMQTFTPDFFAKRLNFGGDNNDKKVPIFIVGMPRSGTTLLEQILCSHPSVYGAGELLDMNDLVNELMENLNQKAHYSLSDGESSVFATKKQMQQLGENYLKRVWKLSPQSAYITDKMPSNFFCLGFIHLALPNAKIIHAMRDPMDSCFSNYSRLFKEGLNFSYHQKALGRYYVRYAELMKHWHRVLPAGRILDVRYEDMVVNTEQHAKRVLDFVGLPWDDACLQFHKTKRAVKTASSAQVIKPIYSTSVARWENFRNHLQPLYELVKDYR